MVERVNIYIWDDVDNLTGNWHNGGAFVAVASTLEAAREAAPAGCSVKTAEPTAQYTLADSGEAPRAFVFQDAGCC
jgi:hypothetical protein